jgi:hypothetical protein
MAVNDTRSMTADFHQGGMDETYIQLTPDRGNVENPPVDRLTWPRYERVEQHGDHGHFEALVRQSLRPIERKAAYGTDPRF